MALRIFDRVKQVTSSIGTGNITLGGTPNGFQSFSDVFSSGDTTYICIENGANWEVSRATYGVDGSGTLSRDTILDSSTGSAINLSGRSTVFCTVPAAKYAYLDPSGEINLSLGGLSDVTVTTPATGDILSYNGSEWVNSVPDPGYGDEQAQDAIGGILGSGADIVLSYNDSTPAITGSLTDTSVTPGSYTLASITVDQKGRISAASSGSVDLSAYLTSVTAASTYVALGGSYSNPTWITSLAWSKLSGLPSAVSNLSGTNTGDQDLSSYATTAAVAAAYLPLVGGTLTGALSLGINDLTSGSITASNSVTAPAFLSTVSAVTSRLVTSGSTLQIDDGSGGPRTINHFGNYQFAVDNTYDIGANGANRPRDGFFSGELTAGGYGRFGGVSGTEIFIGWSDAGVNLIGNTTGDQLWFYLNGITHKFSSYGFGNHTLLNTYIGWASSSVATPDLALYADAANILAQRNDTSAQTFRMYETYTSSTSFGTLQFKATGSAYQIGSAVGSAGGTNRDVEIGHTNAAGTFTAGLTVAKTPMVLAAKTVAILTIPAYSFIGDTNTGIGSHAGDWLTIITGGVARMSFANTVISLPSNAVLSWTSSTSDTTYGNDTGISRSSAGVLQINSGTAGTYRDLILRDLTSTGAITLTQNVSTSGSPTAFTITGAAHTTLATAEVTDGYFNGARTVNFGAVGGTIANQRTWVFTAPTFTAAAATTLTRAATVSITGAPVASTGVTAAKSCALHIENGGLVISGSDSESNRIAIMSSPTFFGTRVNSQAVVFSEAGNGGYIANSGQNSDFGNLYFGYGTTVGSNVIAGLRGSGWCFMGASTPVWFGSTSVVGPSGVSIYAPSANVWEQRNGTNAQTFRVYNTYTSSASYEAGILDWQTEANTFCIGTVKGSAGGSARQLKLVTDGTAALTISTSQAITAASSLTAVGTITSQGAISNDRYAATPLIRVRRAGGTSSSPTQVTTAQTIGIIGSYGYHDGGAFHSSTGASIQFVSTEAYTSTGQGTEIRFATANAGSASSSTRMTIEDSGELTLEQDCHIQTSGNGIKIGTDTSQKFGFWNATPVVQQILATGAGATIDDVINLLQTLGLCKQS